MTDGIKETETGEVLVPEEAISEVVEVVEEAAVSEPLTARGREDILNRGREAFRKKISEERRELEDETLGLFYVYPMTIEEKQKIYDVYTDKRLHVLCTTIVTRCKNEKGHRIFQAADFGSLIREWSADTIERIAAKVTEHDEDDDEAGAISIAEELDPGN